MSQYDNMTIEEVIRDLGEQLAHVIKWRIEDARNEARNEGWNDGYEAALEDERDADA